MEPLICVLVPFTGWNVRVAECVDGCLGLRYDRFVLCLLPDEWGSVPTSVACDPRVHVISTGLPGISRKRNLGIAAHPEADFYACIDSDAVPEPAWLRRGVQAFERSPDIGLVGGPDLSPDYPGVAKRAVRNALSSWLVGGDRVFAKARSPSRFTDDLRTANCLIRRDVIGEVGLFDEKMPVGEDTAFCVLALRSGWKLWFDARVVVRHHNRGLFIPFLKQRLTAGYGIPFLLLNYPDLSLRGWLLRLAPLAMTLYLSLGWLTCLSTGLATRVWISGTALYLGFVLVEAVRHATRFADLPATAVAILIGNLGPGLGILMAAAGVRLDIAAFYRNQDEPERRRPTRSGIGAPPRGPAVRPG